jgi:methionyl-tRNA formyltransferase
VKIVLLTTDTPHHSYFAWKVNEIYPLQAIIVEANTIVPPFDTHHPFEDERDEYETIGLAAGDMRMNEYFNVNACDKELQELAPDLIIVFGTSRLCSEIIRIPPLGCLNLHGGNPEEYRGLDNLLWAIYHKDFDNLMITLHYVTAELDAGDIIVQSRMKFEKDTKLYQLRSINTKTCVRLVLTALEYLDRFPGCQLPSRKQLRIGRYYSFMPACLKEICVKRFERWTHDAN